MKKVVLVFAVLVIVGLSASVGGGFKKWSLIDGGYKHDTAQVINRVP